MNININKSFVGGTIFGVIISLIAGGFLYLGYLR